MESYLTTIATVAAINAMAALGLYLTMSTGQWSLAHATFLGIGAYAAGVLARDTGVPYPVSLAVAAAAGCFFGVGVSLVAARLNTLFMAIITAVFAQAAVVTVSIAPGLGGAIGLYPIPTQTPPILVFVLLGLLGVVARVYEQSRWGYVARAVGADPAVASVLGIRVALVRVLGFAAGGAIAGLAGGLLVQFVGIVEPVSLGFSASIQLFIYVTVGGSGTWIGAVLGALVLTTLPELLRFGAAYRVLLLGIVLLVVMLWRPTGLVHRRPFRLNRRGTEPAAGRS